MSDTEEVYRPAVKSEAAGPRWTSPKEEAAAYAVGFTDPVQYRRFRAAKDDPKEPPDPRPDRPPPKPRPPVPLINLDRAAVSTPRVEKAAPPNQAVAPRVPQPWTTADKMEVKRRCHFSSRPDFSRGEVPVLRGRGRPRRGRGGPWKRGPTSTCRALFSDCRLTGGAASCRAAKMCAAWWDGVADRVISVLSAGIMTTRPLFPTGLQRASDQP